MEKTGLSRRIITKAIPLLLKKGLIIVTDRFGKTLAFGRERSGRTHIYYSSTCALSDTNLRTFRRQPGQRGGPVRSVREIITEVANSRLIS